MDTILRDFILYEGHVETYKNSYQSIISYAAAYTLYSKLWLVRFGSLVVVIALIAKLAKTKKHFCNSKLLAQLILLPCSDENNILQISIQLSCVILLSIKKHNRQRCFSNKGVSTEIFCFYVTEIQKRKHCLALIFLTLDIMEL